MSIWFSSDLHLGHVNIIKYCHRPFDSVEHMDDEIVSRWNDTVMPEDTAFILGDVALGKIAESLPKVGRLNGHKVLVIGNHDRPFMRAGKQDEFAWLDKYREVFQEVVHWETDYTIDTEYATFRLSHFPYNGDSHDEDRYRSVRPTDDGTILIHGHTHSTDVVTFSEQGTTQYHVGMDAHNFRPVPLVKVALDLNLTIIKTNN